MKLDIQFYEKQWLTRDCSSNLRSWNCLTKLSKQRIQIKQDQDMLECDSKFLYMLTTISTPFTLKIRNLIFT